MMAYWWVSVCGVGRGAAAHTSAGDTLILKASPHLSAQCLVLDAIRFRSFEAMLESSGLQVTSFLFFPSSLSNLCIIGPRL